MKRQDIERLLPEVIRRTSQPGSPLFALLTAMEALHAPSEAALDGAVAYFDPRRAPERWLPFLARWVDLNLSITSGPWRARELIAAASRLSQWRGTARGLREFLEIATGVRGFVISDDVRDEAGRRRPFHIEIEVPAGAEPHLPMITSIIESEKPVHVTYELVLPAVA